MTEKILFVDDEPQVLNAFRRRLRKRFSIDTALGGEQALATLDTDGPYAVVVSDMRMPGMDGVRLLSEIKRRAPKTVRIMLTGDSDLRTAVEAVNQGNIFRFLTKPCPLEVLADAIRAGLEQYRLITAERDLLEKTLRGSVKVLSDVLSLANPMAYGHASRVRLLVRKICDHLGTEQAWQCEIASMLSQIGCVTVPTDTLEKVYSGRSLEPEEVEMLAAHPSVGRDLVGNIPRLEGVAEIIGYQDKHFDGSGTPSDSVAGNQIPLGARILKIVLDYDTLKWGGLSDMEVTIQLGKRGGWYDPDVLIALEAVIGFEDAFEVRKVTLENLTASMTLAADVKTEDGTVVVGKGQEVTTSLCQRLRNFSRRRRIDEPIRVYIQADARSHAMV